jgi:hypothetical protein
MAGQGRARRGGARRGQARRGEAWQSKVAMKGLVYIAEVDGLHKVGYTTLDIRRRQSQIQTMTALADVEIVMTISSNTPDLLEGELHRLFWHRKCRKDKSSGEWFKLTKEDFDFLKLNYEEARNEENKHCSSVGGGSPFDVRQVRGGFQHRSADYREAVSGRPAAADYSCNQHLFHALRGKHQVGVQDADGQAGEDNRPRNCFLYVNHDL